MHFHELLLGIGEMNFFSKGNARDGEELRRALSLLEARGHTNHTKQIVATKKKIKILRQHHRKK